jgi:hypothetical protein
VRYDRIYNSAAQASQPSAQKFCRGSLPSASAADACKTGPPAQMRGERAVKMTDRQPLAAHVDRHRSRGPIAKEEAARQDGCRGER